MDLRYGLLADYVTDGANGKTIIVGTFDTVFNTLRLTPVPLPPMFLALGFDAHVAEGTDHNIEIRFTDADGHHVFPPQELPLRFGLRGPGQPLGTHAAIEFPDLKVQSEGEYAFRILHQGRQLGEISLYVAPAPIPRPTP